MCCNIVMECMRQGFISGMQRKRWMWCSRIERNTTHWPWSFSVVAAAVAATVNAVDVRTAVDTVQSPAEIISSFGERVFNYLPLLNAFQLMCPFWKDILYAFLLSLRLGCETMVTPTIQCMPLQCKDKLNRATLCTIVILSVKPLKNVIIQQLYYKNICLCHSPSLTRSSATVH